MHTYIDILPLELKLELYNYRYCNLVRVDYRITNNEVADKIIELELDIIIASSDNDNVFDWKIECNNVNLKNLLDIGCYYSSWNLIRFEDRSIYRFYITALSNTSHKYWKTIYTLDKAHSRILYKKLQLILLELERYLNTNISI